ncbi:MAG TPA: flavin prenyltransferase UbiX [Pirellulales bacterium]|nr:flavin prenyltransferase UbiX [Pirellulales bacterium]
MKPNFVLAITGASGAIYGVRLLDRLLAAGCQVELVISPAGATVIAQELGLSVDLDDFRLESLLPRSLQAAPPLLRTVLGEGWQPPSSNPTGKMLARYHHYRDLMASIASGSSRGTGMVICPCSGGTLSAVAHGTSENLVHRAADVHLKERRKLILVPRETPLSLIQLDNMRRCVEAGAVVLPAMPGFYHGVQTVGNLVDFVVARVLDQLGVEHSLMRRWGE